MTPGGVTLTLNRPPATNNLFRNVAKGRARTQAYDAWIAQALWSVAQQRPGRVSGPFNFNMTVQRPDRRRRDLDGQLKAVLDLLVKAGVTDDDHLCESLSVRWESREPTGQAVFISVEAA